MKIEKKLSSIIISGLFVTPFISFIVLNSLFFPFITGKAFVFRILIEILFCLWFILMIKDESYRPKKSWLLYSVSIFVGVIFLADILGVNFYRSFWSNFERMDGFITLIHFFAYFLMLSTVLKTERVWKYFLNTSLVSSTLLCLFSAIPQIYRKAEIHQSSDRIDATLGNATYLAVYAMIHIAIAAYLALRSNNLYIRLSYVAGILLHFLVLYKTQTRGAMLGLVVGFFISSVLIAIFEKEKKIIRKISVVGLLIATVFVGSFVFLRDSDFVKKSPTLKRFAEVSFTENFLKGQGRYYIWPMAIEGFKERPILGWGQENFNYVFNKNYNPGMYSQEQWFDRTHNIVLDWLIAGGLLGLLSYLFIFVSLLYYVWRGKGGDFSVSDKSILTGLIFAYFFQNLFVFDNITSYLMFFALISYVYSVRKNVDAQMVFEKIKIKSIVGKNVLISVAILATCFTLYSWNIKPIQANRHLLFAVAPEFNGEYEYEKDLESFKKSISYNTFGISEAREHLVFLARKTNNKEDVPENVRQAIFQEAKSEMEKQIKENASPDARYHLFLGSLLSSYGLFDQAIDYLKKANELSPKKQSVYFEIITLLARQGRDEEAFNLAKEVYDLEKNYISSKMIYYSLSLRTKRFDLAKEILSDVNEEIYVFDENFLNTYLDLKMNNEALALLKRRIELDPANPQYRISLAAFYYLNLNNKALSIQAVNDFIKLDPEKFKAQGEYFINQINVGIK
jgi:O-antigen ligase